MTNVRSNSAIAITFEGEPLNPGFSGIWSMASWDDSNIMPVLRELFHCREDEKIVAIEVDNFGIKAKFKQKGR